MVAQKERSLARSVLGDLIDSMIIDTQARYLTGSIVWRAVNWQRLALYSARSVLVRVEAERRLHRVNLHLAPRREFRRRGKRRTANPQALCSPWGWRGFQPPRRENFRCET